jgi:hypothetical protein
MKLTELYDCQTSITGKTTFLSQLYHITIRKQRKMATGVILMLQWLSLDYPSNDSSSNNTKSKEMSLVDR